MEKEIRRAGRNVLIPFGVFLVLLALLAGWGIRYAYWHSFSTAKWINHPSERAKMTADLLGDHELAGMSEEQIRELLGPDDSALGYFNREDRLVYCLGSERTVIDREWLLIDFEADAVSRYSVTVD